MKKHIEQIDLPFQKPYVPFKQYLIDSGYTCGGTSKLSTEEENRYLRTFRINVMGQLMSGLLDLTPQIISDIGIDAYKAAACAKNIDVIEGRIKTFDEYWQVVKAYITAAGISELQCHADFDKLKKTVTL